jgi:hypothetical protein
LGAWIFLNALDGNGVGAFTFVLRSVQLALHKKDARVESADQVLTGRGRPGSVGPGTGGRQGLGIGWGENPALWARLEGFPVGAAEEQALRAEAGHVRAKHNSHERRRA